VALLERYLRHIPALIAEGDLVIVAHHGSGAAQLLLLDMTIHAWMTVELSFERSISFASVIAPAR
jgi:hypothetical protein